MNHITKFIQKLFIPPRPILGRWTVQRQNYIKTDLANHDCCGDELCGDPKLTKIYISNNLYENNKTKQL